MKLRDMLRPQGLFLQKTGTLIQNHIKQTTSVMMISYQQFQNRSVRWKPNEKNKSRLTALLLILVLSLSLLTGCGSSVQNEGRFAAAS